MRTLYGLPLLALVTACGGGTIDIGEDAQRRCPAARVDVEELAFADALFAGGEGQSVTFLNNCTNAQGDLVLELRVDGDPGFAPSSTELTIAPGESETVQVEYVPSGYGPGAGTLAVSTNDPDVPELTVQLTGTTNPDQDGDGFTADIIGGTDCDDLDPEINPGVPEVWYDGIDQNCDGANDYDQDGDGFEVSPDGGDCDDLDPTVNPDAAETDDLVDDDCDGWVDEDFVRPNDILVTEVMADPVAVFDTSGEWFEVQNISERRVNLRNWRVVDYDGDSFLIIGDWVLRPGQRMVLGVEADESRNGGVSVDLAYSRDSFDLGNARDTIALEVAGSTVTLLEYDVQWSVEPGAALSLDPLFVRKDTGSLGAYWCAATTPLPGGDTGTPGVANDECSSVDHDGDGISIDDGDCNDADPGIYPGAPESWDGIDEDCDGILDNAKIAVVADGKLQGSTRQYLSYAASLSTGDVDGDGQLELIVGSTRVGGTYNGLVWTLDASKVKTWASIVDTVDEAEVDSGGAYSAMALIGPVQGDVTGDGAADLVIGGSTPYTGSGPALMLLENGSGIRGNLDADDALATWTGPRPYDIGKVISHVDMDGDGTAEIAYGDPYFTGGGGGYYQGAVHLIDAAGASGEASLTGDAFASFWGSSSADYLGTALEGGDLDGDGYDELIVCGIYADFGGVINGGGCAILPGTADRPDSERAEDAATAVISARSANARIGTAARLALGDFDSDGELDLVVPDPVTEEVSVFFSIGDLSGDYDTGDSDVTIRARSGPAAFGMGVAAGDFDGDGVDDLAVGAPDSLYYTGAGADQPGVVYAWTGDTLAKASVTLDERDALGYAIGAVNADAFGYSILAADLDGDGTDDLTMGAPAALSGNGRIYILLND